ncbi:uncharacterized protein BX664DRAFT_143943 [Halteromyces radiatus]|uniref:uncharacterized protein n=1 Tax=Halteromyces radiatus TaxID=101107 RepID=UPI00221F9980|nr:uncharacterized protein BX664DRAFT_143943 [Halteromyces radiatus]KAI8089891.1 hypothetical protein BX664DRAFT_143943 [Halteromyces radiatus]
MVQFCPSKTSLQCGLVVCSRCSTKRVKLSFSGIIHDPQLSVDEMYKTSLQPQRICDDCFRHISRPLQQQECSTSNMDNTYCPYIKRRPIGLY